MKTLTHFLHSMLFGMIITGVIATGAVISISNSAYAVSGTTNTGMTLIPRTELEKLNGSDYKGSPMYKNAIQDFDITVMGEKINKNDVSNLRAHKRTVYILSNQDGDYYKVDYFLRDFFFMNSAEELVLAGKIKYSGTGSAQHFDLRTGEYSGSIRINNVSFPLSDFEYVTVQYEDRTKYPLDKEYFFLPDEKYGYMGLPDEAYLPVNKSINENSIRLFEYEKKVLNEMKVDYTATGKYIRVGFDQSMLNAIDSANYDTNSDRNQLILITLTYLTLIVLAGIGGYKIGTRKATEKK